MPRVRIALLSAYPNVTETFIAQIKNDLALFKPTSRLENGHTVISVNDYELEFVVIKNNEVALISALKPQLFLYLFPPRTSENEKEYQEDAAFDLKQCFEGQIPASTQAHLVFLGDGKSAEEQAIRANLASIFPNVSCLTGKKVGQEIMAYATKVAPPAPAKPRAGVSSSTSSSRGDKENSPYVISRITGAFLRAVFGAIVSLFVYNPVSSMFAALSALHREITNKNGDKKFLRIIEFLIILPFSPIWGPLKGLLYDGIYRQVRRGWRNGIIYSLRPFTQIPFEANLSNFSGPFYNTNQFLFKCDNGLPISQRNLIAGIIILSLVIAAGLAVWLPAVNAILGISAYAALHGLGSLSLIQLALAAAGAAMVACTFLYGLGVGIFNLDKVITKAISKQSQEDSNPGNVSKFFGAIVAAVYAILAGIVIYNPVSSIFMGIGGLAEIIGGFIDGGISTPCVFIAPLAFLTTFIWLPLLGTYSHWNEITGGDYIMSPKMRNVDVIAGLVTTALVVAAGLAFVIPPVSIFLGIPALLTTYGLAGMAPWSLALIAAGVTFAVPTVLYSVCGTLYHFYAWRRAKAISAAESSAMAGNHSQTASTTEATRRMSSQAGRSDLEAVLIEPPCQNSGGIFYNLTSCLAGICSGSSKKSVMRSDDDQPLSVADGAPVNKI